MCSGPARIPGRNPVGIERTSRKTVLASSARCRKATEAHKGQRTRRRNTFSCPHYAIRSQVVEKVTLNAPNRPQEHQTSSEQLSHAPNLETRPSRATYLLA